MPFSPKRIAVFGASGAIGSAFVHECLDRYETAKVFCFARSPDRIPVHDRVKRHALSLDDLEELKTKAEAIKADGGLDLIFVATGQLHSPTAKPEKTIRTLSMGGMEETFHTNTILPAMIMKHFLPLLPKQKKKVFSRLSQLALAAFPIMLWADGIRTEPRRPRSTCSSDVLQLSCSVPTRTR